MLFNEPQTLIVVYKEELYSNFLKKLVETNDDNGDDAVVGTRDGSIHVVAWTEKVWRDQKKAGNINNKVLFLGDIKGTDKLLPIIDVKYDEFGIQFGWAGNQAVLHVDTKVLKKEGYQKFYDIFSKMPVPESMKVNAIKKDKESAKEKTVAEEKQDKKRIWDAVKGYALGGVPGALISLKFDVDNAIQQQQFIFGIYKLYESHLKKYINN